MEKRYLSLASFSSIIVLIDQITKYLVRYYLYPGENVTVIKKFFYITLLYNPGGAMGFSFGNRYLLLIFSIMALIFMFFYFRYHYTKWHYWGSILIIGGAIGNIIDRIVLGEVVDFLRFDFGPYTFPIFNIADTAVTIGIFLIIIDNFIRIRKEDSEEGTVEEVEADL